MEHRLTIHCLRDIDASCSCGKWHLTGTTTNHDTDQQLRHRVDDQFRMHLVRCGELATVPPDSHPGWEHLESDIEDAEPFDGLS